MGELSNISWTDATFNPVIGCTKISPACDHCYAASYANKYEPLVTWGEPGTRVKHRRTAESNWKQPLRWNKRARQENVPKRVFCASLSDVFDSDWEPQWHNDLWDLIGACDYLDWLLLTKRPQNIHKLVPQEWLSVKWPRNVWVGTTAENQEEYDRRKPWLLSIPAPVRFFSCEPLLGPIDLGASTDPHGDWYIVGGESGSKRRPMSMMWVEQLRFQVSNRGAAFFFKQDASHKPGSKGRASEALWACKQVPSPTTPAAAPR